MSKLPDKTSKGSKHSFTQQDFINKVNEQYHKAHFLMEDKGDYDIYRGTAHSVSGYMEDAFAVYMAHRINDKNRQFIVDKLISYKGEQDKKATTFKPDLAIINNDFLTHYYDLKTNLGWQRDLNHFIQQKNELIEKIKGQIGTINFPHIDEKNEGFIRKISFSEDIKYQIVVFNGWNINQDLLKKNIDQVDKLNNVQLHILHDWDDKNKKLVLNQQAFDDLI